MLHCDSPKLYLSWAPPPASPGEPEDLIPIATLERLPEGPYRLTYLEGLRRARACRGYPGMTEFPEDQPVHLSAALWPRFAKRLMNARRPDRLAHLEALGLPHTASALAELGASGHLHRDNPWQIFPAPLRLPQGRLGDWHTPVILPDPGKYVTPGTLLLAAPLPRHVRLVLPRAVDVRVDAVNVEAPASMRLRASVWSYFAPRLDTPDFQPLVAGCSGERRVPEAGPSEVEVLRSAIEILGRVVRREESKRGGRGGLGGAGEG